MSQETQTANTASGGEDQFINRIVGGEYFINTDPGKGNGTAFTPEDGVFDSETESLSPP